MKRYCAIPEAASTNCIYGDSYNEVMKICKEKLIKDPKIKSYHIFRLSCRVSVKVDTVIEIHDDFKSGKATDVECEFDPLPSDLPPPPEGCVYFGHKQIYEHTYAISENILGSASGEWCFNCYGDSAIDHYAVKKGTKQYDDAVKAHKLGRPLEVGEY